MRWIQSCARSYALLVVGLLAGAQASAAEQASASGTRSSDRRVDSGRLLREYVAYTSVECLLVLRASASNPSEVILFACGEDNIPIPDLEEFVAEFRAGLGPSEKVTIDVVHNHPERMLVRTHASADKSYRRFRRVLGLREIAQPVLARQIRMMRAGELPCAVLPPSTDDVVTALKILLLSEAQGVDVTFYVPGLEGSWKTTRNAVGWQKQRDRVKSLLLQDRVLDILRGAATPRSDLEREYASLFQEYYLLRNQVAQAFSEQAFGRFERGDARAVERERAQAERRLRRLKDVSMKLGLMLDFEPHAWVPARLPEAKALELVTAR